MRMVILMGRIYMTNDDGLYTPVTFTAVPGGVIMTSGEPMTWDQVTAEMINSLLRDDTDVADMITALKGAALLNQWEEGFDE